METKKQKYSNTTIKKDNNIFENVSGLKKIKVPINEPKENLNEKIWEKGMKIKKDIRLQLLKIAKEFYGFLKIDLKIKDIIFTGSMANYNWTEKSDIDLHLILDIPQNEETDFINEYLLSKKIIWNNNRDIKIKGYEVELYAKDKESLTTSKGVFSILKDKWVQTPSKQNVEIDEASIKKKVSILMNMIDKVEKIKNDKKKLDSADKIRKKLKNLRSTGLEKGGEFSIENLTFKTLRKNGYIEKLSNIKNKSYNEYLSLDEVITEQKKGKGKYELGCLMLDFNISNWDKILKTINEKDVYKKSGFGYEKEPHITALYGFLPNEVSENMVKRVVQKYTIDKNKIFATLTNISFFESEEYDVLKFDVDSPELEELNSVLSKLPNKNDFPDYHPHMTLAYLKKGTAKKYAKTLKNPITLSSAKFKYTCPPDKKSTFTLDDLKMVTLGVQKGIKNLTSEKIDLIKEFILFTIDKLDLKEPVSIYLHKGRDEYIMTTASYVPSENSNHVRAEGRALVDICRSIGHEMVHNKQREIESFKIDEKVQNIGGWIEDEANAKAGVLIKDFAINMGNDKLYEF